MADAKMNEATPAATTPAATPAAAAATPAPTPATAPAPTTAAPATAAPTTAAPAKKGSVKQAQKKAKKAAAPKAEKKAAAPKAEKKAAAPAPAKAETTTKTTQEKKPDTVPMPESLKKQAKSQAEIVAEKKSKKKAMTLKSRAQRLLIMSHARKYFKEYKAAELQKIALRREARHTGNFYREPDAKLIFAIRLKGIMNLTPKTRKVLQLLRLRQLNNGVFVRINKATLELLRLASPYITFGYPNLKSVRELIYKRGYGRVHGQRIRISNNDMIKRALGGHGIVCIEDLIHEIYTVGPHFKQANKFLWSFKLDSPKGGFNRKSISYCEGGDYGLREEKINQLIQKMN